jgi:predicted nucleic acid-binding Zn ribbon protein
MIRRRETRQIGRILDSLIRKLEQTNIKKGTAVTSAFFSAVGDEAIKHTRPVSFKKGILMVIVENSPWLYKLTIEKRNIIEKFNKEYTGRKKATDIRYRIGSIEE